ncbi:hypothetical protein BDF19DRAFT_281949 [Syncephalis fuscata]|nr:hypothetical protein BDF19DRAFT_281949 [Syncephalis fuscata]
MANSEELLEQFWKENNDHNLMRRREKYINGWAKTMNVVPPKFLFEEPLPIKIEETTDEIVKPVVARKERKARTKTSKIVSDNSESGHDSHYPSTQHTVKQKPLTVTFKEEEEKKVENTAIEEDKQDESAVKGKARIVKKKAATTTRTVKDNDDNNSGAINGGASTSNNNGSHSTVNSPLYRLSFRNESKSMKSTNTKPSSISSPTIVSVKSEEILIPKSHKPMESMPEFLPSSPSDDGRHNDDDDDDDYREKHEREQLKKRLNDRNGSVMHTGKERTTRKPTTSRKDKSIDWHAPERKKRVMSPVALDYNQTLLIIVYRSAYVIQVTHLHLVMNRIVRVVRRQ